MSSLASSKKRCWPMREHGHDIHSSDYLNNFKLKIYGEVVNSYDLSWSGLLQLPRQLVRADLGLAPWQRQVRSWTGVPLDVLLTAAEASRGASHASFLSEGGYSTTFELDDLIWNGLSRGAILAFEVDGEPLPRSAGGPLRLVFPNLQAWRCAKWVRGICLTSYAPS